MELLLVILISLFNIILGVLVLLSGRKKIQKSKIFFVGLLFSLAVWSLVTFFEEEKINQQLVQLLVHLDFAFATLTAFFFYLFSIHFPKEQKTPSIRIVPIYITTALFFLGSFSKLYVQDINFLDEGIKFVTGPLYLAFFFYFLFYLFAGILRLSVKSRQARGIERQQISYVLFGLMITGFIAVLTNLILPPLGLGGTLVARLGIYGILIFNLTTTYSIIRHRLLEIRAIINRSLVYGVLVSIIALSFILILFLSAEFFQDSAASRNIFAFVVAIFIVFGLDPLKQWLSKITDKVFFKAKVDYQLLLREISEIVGFEINRDELIRKISQKLEEGLKVKQAVVLLRKQVDGKTEKFEAPYDLLTQNPNLSLPNNSALINFLREHRHFSIVESLERKIEDTPEPQRKPLIDSKAEFDRLGIALVTPIYAQGHLIAVLALSPKLSGDTFSNDDIQMIEVLSPQLGSAIQKANLFEEVRQFNIGLQQKVQDATKQLREQNVSLETLQKITKEVTRTLDFNQVAQRIADSVATELGYVGAILVLLDEDGHTVRARAVTDTPVVRRALKVLPKHFSEYPSDLNNPKYVNMEARVLRTGKIEFTNHIADVVCPPLPRFMANSIQAIIGIKSIVVIPILSEEKVIGVIEVGAKKTKDEFSEAEIETLQSVADELGIVSRNLKLFGQLQQTNKQLEVANEHLKELDRAKSEFVSIASHQLRTPMTGIMGYLSMMTQGDFGKIKPEHATILNNLLAESQRMIRLINQFLNVSKIEAGKFTYTKKPVQLIDLINQEVNELRKAITDKGLKIETKIPKTLPIVTADGDKLQDVILNLIDNAIKYTEKGTITVGVEALDDHVRFYVKDSGIGIKPEDAHELFNKFVRGSGIAQIHPDGSGLGLFIAKSIIDSHGGRIWAESEGEGKGSTFQFIIPVFAVDAPDEEHTRDAAAHVVSTKRT